MPDEFEQMGKEIRRPREFGLRKIFVFSFLLLVILDITTTGMVIEKHSEEGETNPLFLMGIPIWILVIVKAGGALALVWYYLLRYNDINIFNNSYFRYAMVWFLVLITFIYMGIVVQNIRIYNYESVIPLPKEERAEKYVEQVGDMKVMENLTPYKKGFKVPSIISLFILNMIQFIVFKSFEKDRKWLSSKQNRSSFRLL